MSDTESGLWIRIRRLCGSGFSDFVDPYWESGSRIRIQGQEKNNKYQWKNALFSYLKKIFTTKKVLFEKIFDELHRYF
jgi:hypothetical protein